MKHFFTTFLFIAVCTYFVLSKGAILTAAQSPTKKPTPTPSEEVTPTEAVEKEKTKQIEDLKDRLATKVAELRQVQKRAIFGAIKTVSVSNFLLETSDKTVKIELPEELAVAQILKGKRTDLTTENLEANDIVTVFGEYDTTLDILNAKAVFIQAALPTFTQGIITDVDEEAFTVKITTPQNEHLTVDIEKTTKTNVWSAEENIQKAGFSKLDTGDTILVWGIVDPKDSTSIRGEKVLSVGGGITGAQPAATPTAENTPNVTPSPTKKPAPTATPAE